MGRAEGKGRILEGYRGGKEEDGRAREEGCTRV